MTNQTPLQNFIEQKITNGSFYDKIIEDNVDYIIPKHLQDTERGLKAYLMNLEYKTRRIHPDDSKEKRRINYIILDDNEKLIKVALLSEDILEGI